MRSPVLLLALALAACGTRPVNLSDGGALDASPKSDHPGLRLEGGPFSDGPIHRMDACVRPPGSCSGDQDCPPGSECIGCGPNPCCPTCDVCMGTCQPRASACVDNGDCKPDEFCSLNGCGMLLDPPGACKPRPEGCLAVYMPVCGCDGKTHGNDCEAHAAGVSVKAKGTCCEELAKHYASLLPAARKCCAFCADPTDTCSQTVEMVLGCSGCLTSVNADAPELSTLKSLAALWASQGCQPAGCPPVACPPVKTGACQPSPGSPGVCTDVH